MGDPTCYGVLTLDLTPVEKFLKEYNEKNPEVKLTLTHVVLKSLGEASAVGNCTSNGKITFGAFAKRNYVNTMYVTNISGKKFEYILMENLNLIGIKEIARQLANKTKLNKSNPSFFSVEKFDFLKYLPSFILEILFYCFVFVNYDLGLKIFGIPAECFGYNMLVDV